MTRIDLPTNVPRRKPPLRKRALQAAGWIAFVGGGIVTPRLAAKAAARVWCKLPANTGRRKDNRPWPGQVSYLPTASGSKLAVETWQPYSHPADAAAPATSRTAGETSPGLSAARPGPATDAEIGDGAAAATGFSPNSAPTATHVEPTSPTESAGQSAADAGDEGGVRTVLLVHGWGGWRGQVAAFVAPLTRAGFRVVAFDSLSHGDSGPGEHGAAHSNGGEMMRSLETLVDGIGQPYGVIAHSLGCAAVCRLYLNGKLSCERLTLVSPNPDMRQVAHAFAGKLGFRRRAERMLIEEMEKRAHGRLSDFDVAEMGATGLLPEALVIHDAVDRESPYRVAQDIAAAWPGVTLMTTEGLGHHRVLIKPAVVEAAAANIID
jgi:pimeloyl-ACP methyl ester carboxylesterase